MNDVVDYLTEFDPGFPTKIKPATREEIVAFEEYTGYQLPPEYRSFLRLMGRSTGGIPLLNDGTSDIRKLLHFYNDVTAEDDQPAPMHYFVIAIAGTLIPEVYLKACAASCCQVGCGEDPGNWGRIADSLRNRLFQSAFLHVNMESAHPRFAHTLRFSTKGKRRRLQAIAEHLKRLDMKMLDCTDTYNVCGEREDAAVVAQHWEHGNCWVCVAASVQQKAKTIGNSLAHAFGLQLVKPLTKPRASYLS
jgi:hypothetical protein